MTNLQIFCRQVRARSAENRQAMAAVRNLPGQMVSILRQELDSMIRVIFLLSQSDRQYRSFLIENSVAGKGWRQQNSRQLVTDREMVELADALHGWTRSIYDFGCAFIHLSNLHDHQVRDPLDQIGEMERNAFHVNGHATGQPFVALTESNKSKCRQCKNLGLNPLWGQTVLCFLRPFHHVGRNIFVRQEYDCSLRSQRLGNLC
jgi:hypothetical protein